MLVILALLIIRSSTPLYGNNTDCLSIYQTRSINGIATILIFLSHATQYLTWGVQDEIFLSFRDVTAQLVVVPFMGFSGYGIMKCLLAGRKKYLESYLKRRVGKTWIMFAGAVILYILINLMLGNHYTYLDYLGAFTAWVNIGNSNWYIFSILFLYLVVYIVFKYSYDTRDLLHILMVAGMCLIYAVSLKCLGKESFWYNTVLVFPAGMFWAYEEKCLTAFIKKNWVYEGCVVIALLALGMSLAYVKNIVGFQISSMACFMLLILISMKLQLKSKILNSIGNYAFEIFIFQRIGFMISERIFTNRYIFLAVSMIITGIIAKSYRKLLAKLL